jgi:hypothetical protein
MTQALYAHMNNNKKKEQLKFLTLEAKLSTWLSCPQHIQTQSDRVDPRVLLHQDAHLLNQEFIRT